MRDAQIESEIGGLIGRVGRKTAIGADITKGEIGGLRCREKYRGREGKEELKGREAQMENEIGGKEGDR